MITAEQINEMLEAAKPSIIEGFKQEIKQSISWEVKNNAAKIVAEETTKWVKENIIPELIKELVESKNGLISVGAKLAPAMVESLVESMANDFKSKMEKSWDRSRIFEVIFKS